MSLWEEEIQTQQIDRKGFPGGEEPASSGDAGDTNSIIPGLGRSPEEGTVTHSSILPGESLGQESVLGSQSLCTCLSAHSPAAASIQDRAGKDMGRRRPPAVKQRETNVLTP